MSNLSARPASTQERARLLGQRGLLLLASLTLLGGAFAAARPAPAQANAAQANTARARVSTSTGSDQATRVRNSPAAIAVSGTTAYVVNTIDGTVTPVDVRTGKAAGPLNVGAYNYPTVITITGQTAVVIEPYGYTVELINLKTRRVFPPITVGAFPTAVAITA